MDFSWLTRLLPASPAAWWTLGGAIAVLLLALVWRARRGRAPAPVAPDPEVQSANRYAGVAPINDEQVALLRYLQTAFPDGAVLFRPRLGRFMTLRSGGDRVAARQWLGRTYVDFLLCGDDGKPLYAFEIDLLRQRDDERAQQRLTEKYRALRSAGIRMIRFKGALATWPEPEVLRERVLAVARPVVSGFGANGLGNSALGHSRIEPSGFGPSRGGGRSRIEGVSSMMSLSDLAPLGAAGGNNAWSSVGKRS